MTIRGAKNIMTKESCQEKRKATTIPVSKETKDYMRAPMAELVIELRSAVSVEREATTEGGV